MRGKAAPERHIAPDPKFQSVLLAKFINVIMERGKKTVARKIVYTSLAKVAEETKQEPMEAFELAMKNVTPVVEVKSRRVGGSNYQVPVEVSPKRRQALAFRWLIGAARSKKGRPMAVKLAEEIVLASQNQGDAVRKKQDVHRMAESNRAFAHFA